jgi:uncharacterized protein (DUF342 family)
MTYTSNQIKQAFASGKSVGLLTALQIAKKYNLNDEIKDLESRIAMFEQRYKQLEAAE